MNIDYIIRTLPAIVMLTGIMSCDQSASKYSRLTQERDSLKTENEIQAKNLNSIAGMIDTINSVLDSIAIEEGMLFLSPTKEIKYAKSKTLRDLDRFENVLRHQQRRIDELDSLLSLNVNNNQSGMRILIANLKLELEKKDVQITKLRNELSKKMWTSPDCVRKFRSKKKLSPHKKKQSSVKGIRSVNRRMSLLGRMR